MLESALLIAATLTAPGPRRTYEIYQPHIECYFIVHYIRLENQFDRPSDPAPCG